MDKHRNEIVVMDISGIYAEETFYEGKDVYWLSLGDISGTNCYCDSDAMEEIRNRISDFSPKGIHFLDSGNYHYMSRIWIEKIERPFRLLVFDNHTDMQLPAFGGLLSCGGWIAAALNELPNLKEVILIGPDEEAYSQVEEDLKKKVYFLSREKLAQLNKLSAVMHNKEHAAEIKAFQSKLPLYISIDKDILRPGEADTSWSQGDITLEQLMMWIDLTITCGKETGSGLIGVDICGESDSRESTGSAANDKANAAILNYCFMNRRETVNEE